ncbi:MAG: HAD-IC family P-type ATPase [Candidatus Kerfeldbacteria bacterium]|nr:HAD-IC family P-type ATPase [Candidatus Kerfeldbacteria bacterium]
MQIAKFTTQTAEQTLAGFNVTVATGLTADRVTALQQQYGRNALVDHHITPWSILIRQFKSSFVYLLVGAAVLALILGETIDGVMVLIFVGVNAALGFFQEYRSEKTSQLLSQYTVPHTKVRRAGTVQRIPSPQVVPGDILLFEAGDIIPADCRVVQGDDAMVDETILTGESIPIQKTITALTKATDEIYEASNILFAGTTVVSGEVVGAVIATGSDTAMGEVAKLTTETKRVSSFEVEINHFSRFILRLVVITLVIIFIVNLIIKGPTDWVDLVIFAIALAVGVIPEGLPVVTTFSLSRGALRLSKKHVVVKRLTAIEDLGGIEVLCTDKTGTITENKLTVAEGDATALWHAALASLEVVKDQSEQPNNAFDLAIWKAITPDQQAALAKAKRLAEVPFDPERRRNSALVEADNQRVLIVRGAVEILCGFCPALDEAACERMQLWVAEQGKLGRRVIAVAKKTWTKDSYEMEDELTNLEYVGCLSFVDPIKESTHEAVADAKELGVVVKMITGDSKEVAGAVALEAGLAATADAALLAADLEAMPHDQQLVAVREHNVFARVSPKQKFHIIQLLQEQKLHVGFLGEGINDAPALKVANISLVVQGASDIAREAADVILLKQSLDVIMDGIREGRAVFANTMKYIQATLSSNFGNFYAVAIVSLFIDFLPMLPLQILLVNLLSDFPMITIAADRVDQSELRKPKSYHIKDILLLATFLGIVSTVFDFIFFALFRNLPPSGLQTNWFIGSIITELLFLFSIRRHGFLIRGTRPAPIIIILSLAAAALTVIIPFTSLGHNIFQFTSPTLMQLATIGIVAAIYLVVTESVKLLYFKRQTSEAT